MGFKEWCCMLTHIYSTSHSSALGVGNTKGSGGGDEDEDPEEVTTAPWMGLLNNNNGVYALKPLKEVLRMGANGKTMGHAIRHIMRQAWSKCSPIVKNCLLNPILVI